MEIKQGTPQYRLCLNCISRQFQEQVEYLCATYKHENTDPHRIALNLHLAGWWQPVYDALDGATLAYSLTRAGWRVLGPHELPPVPTVIVDCSQKNTVVDIGYKVRIGKVDKPIDRYVRLLGHPMEVTYLLVPPGG